MESQVSHVPGVVVMVGTLHLTYSPLTNNSSLANWLNLPVASCSQPTPPAQKSDPRELR
jgi:hypothetical protein